MANSRKIVGIDLARSFAMLLAMSAHALTVAGAHDYVMEVATPVFIPVRLATPIFITILGVMLEIVYTKRLLQFGVFEVSKRLFERAFLCWVLYALSNLPLLMTGRIGLGHYAGIVALIGTSPFTDILRYYTLIFFLSPLLLLIRIRVGSVIIMAATAALLFTHSYFVMIPAPDGDIAHGSILRLIDLVFGIGDGAVGPSIIHSIFFIATGMTLAPILRRPDAAVNDGMQLRVGRLLCLLAALATGTILALYVGPEIVDIVGVTTKNLRNANHPFFFFNGALWSCIIIVLFSFVKFAGDGPFRLTMLGQESLFTFAFGNAFLASLLGHTTAHGPTGVFIAAVLVVTVVVFSAVYDVIIRPETETSHNRLVANAAKLTRAVLKPPNVAISRVASWVARIFFGRYKIRPVSISYR